MSQHEDPNDRRNIMNVNAKDRIKYHRMLGRYLKAYGEEYSEREREYIKENFLSDASINPDIMLQIYAKFGMLSQEENFYLGFARLIGQRYGWDAKVLEVGGGYFLNIYLIYKKSIILKELLLYMILY